MELSPESLAKILAQREELETIARLRLQVGYEKKLANDGFRDQLSDLGDREKKALDIIDDTMNPGPLLSGDLEDM